MGTDESRAKYHNKAKDTLYNYYPALDKDVITSQRNLADTEALLGKNLELQLESSSDPICSSAGCTQYNHPGDSSAKIPRNYFVPNFGKDPDMTGTMNSISIAEALKKHHLIMGTEESRAKYHKKAKDTLYNYYPALDKDVITTQRNLVAAEETLGQKLE
jgi:hypothetical protein